MTYREKGIAQMDYQVSGLDNLSKVGNVITGINQGLELMEKGMRATTSAVVPFVATGSQFENYGVQFETFLGSAELAKETMEELFQIASSTPFQLPDVVQAAQSLEAYGILSERTLRVAGDAASAFGKDFNETSLAIAAATTGELERLKQFGITSRTLAAEMGHAVSRESIQDLQDIGDAVVNILEDKAGGGMERMMDTLDGKISNLGDAWTRFKKIVADNDLFETTKEIFGSILDTVNELFESGKAENLGKVIGETLSDLMWNIAENMAKAVDALLSLADVMGYKSYETKAGEKQGRLSAVDAEIAALRASGVGAPVAASRGIDLSRFPADVARVSRSGGGMMTAAAGQLGSYGGSVSAEEALQNYNRLQELLSERGRLADWLAMPEDDTLFGRLRGARLAAGMGPDYGPNLPGSAGPGLYSTYGAQGPQQPFQPLGTGTRVDTYGPAGKSELEQDRERYEARESAVRDTTERMAGHWDNYYGKISKVAQKWKKLDDVRIKDVWQATISSSRAMLAEEVGNMAKKAAVKQMYQAAEALASGASFNLVSAAKHAAAAVAFGAIGGIAGGIIAGDDSGPDPAQVEVTNAGDIGGGGGSTRSISQSAGVRAENITNNIYIVHNDAAVYGADGLDELTRMQIMPIVLETMAMEGI